MGLGYFYKHFLKNTRIKGPAGKDLGVYSPRYPQNYILNRKFNSKMNIIRAFFTKSGHFFLIFIIGQGTPAPSPTIVMRLGREEWAETMGIVYKFRSSRLEVLHKRYVLRILKCFRENTGVAVLF